MRRYAIVLILILAAVVTPPDMMSQLILFFGDLPALRGLDLPDPPDREEARGGSRAQGLWVEPDEDEAEQGKA